MITPTPTEDEPPSARTPESRIHPARQLAYMEQDCGLTVREGLEEYYEQIDDLITEENALPEVAALFRHHDLTHVVFGCDTSIAGETRADMWALSGTDVTLREYSEYFRMNETNEIFAALGTWTAIRQMVRALPLVPKVIWRARIMHTKWPFWDNEAYLDRPLCEVRSELGIHVL